MPRAEVIFHRLASKEYREARQWYLARSVQAAAGFVDAVDRATRRIAETPESLAMISPKYRWVRVRRFPYTVIFFARSEREMVVIAVAHTSRRPGYWRQRK